MFNKIINLKTVSFLLFLSVLFSTSIILEAQNTNKNNAVMEHVSKQIASNKANNYLGIFSLLQKSHGIIGSTVRLEFSRENSSNYLGVIDSRTTNRIFNDTYSSFVINLKFSIFDLK